MSAEPELSPMVVADEAEALLLEAFRENPERTVRLLMAVKTMPKGLSAEEKNAYISHELGDA